MEKKELMKSNKIYFKSEKQRYEKHRRLFLFIKFCCCCYI